MITEPSAHHRAHLSVTFTPAEGALLRLLGLVERRGFRIHAVTFAEAADGTASAELTVSSRQPGRTVAILSSQIARLYEVIDIATSDETTPTAFFTTEFPS